MTCFTDIPNKTLEDAVQNWLTLSKTNPFDTWLILENPAAVQKAKALIQTPMLSGHITTLKQLALTIFIEQYPNKTLLSEVEVLIKISEITHGSLLAQNKTLPLSFINQIIGVYNFLRMHQINLADIKNTLKPTPDNASTIDKIDKFNDIFERFETWCKSNTDTKQYFDIFAAEEELLTLLENNNCRLGNVIIYKTAPKNRLEQTILARICETAKQVIEIKSEKFDIVRPDTLQKENIRIFETPKNELESVLEQAALLLENNLAKPEDILILTPDIVKTRQIYSIISSDFYIFDADNILRPVICSTNTGLPALNYPIAQYIVSALNAAAYDYKLSDFQPVLSCPYFPFVSARSLTPGKLSQIAKITGIEKGKSQWLNAHKRFEFKTEGTKEELNYDKNDENKLRLLGAAKDIDAIIQRIDQLTHGKTYRERCASLKTWLENTTWKCDTFTPEEEQVKKILTRYLDKISASTIADNPCSLKEFVIYLTHYLEKTEVKTDTDTENCIQIAKIRHAANLKAKYVFIIGLSADSIPNVTTLLPPFTEKETEKLYKDLKKDRYEADFQNFTAALQCADEKLWLSCSRKNGTKHTTPSAFFMKVRGFYADEDDIPEEPVEITHSTWYNQIQAGKIIHDGAAEKTAENLAGLCDWEKVKAGIELEERDDSEYPDFSKTEIASQFSEKYGENYSFAPTTIEKYLKCPYRWFLEKHLNLYSPNDAASEKVSVGNAIHAALEEFVKTFKEDITEDNKTRAITCLKSLCEKNLDDLKLDTPQFTAVKNRYLGEKGLPSIIEAFVDNEIKLNKKGFGFKDSQAEVEMNKIRITSENSGKSFLISGKIDRIAEGQNNTFRVIDYKTGTSFKTDLSKGNLIQIPLYIKAYQIKQQTDTEDKIELQHETGYYLLVTHTTLKEVNYFKIKNNPPPVSDQINEKIDLCIENIENMRLGKCNIKTGCDDEYCPYSRICRRDPDVELTEGES